MIELEPKKSITSFKKKITSFIEIIELPNLGRINANYFKTLLF